MSAHKAKYYKLLGVEINATQQEIRKAYRKLVMRYHPDKNPSKEASLHFLKITEAYEILIGKRVDKREKIVRQHGTTQKTKEDRIKEAQKRYQDQIRKERLENEFYFQSLFVGTKWKIIKISSVIGIIFSLSILCDYFLPRHFNDKTVVAYAKNIHEGGTALPHSIIELNDGKRYWVNKMNYSLYGEFPDVLIEKTWLLHEPVRVHSYQKIKYVPFNIKYTFYSNGYIAIFVFLIPLFVRLYRKRTVYYTFIYHFALYISTASIAFFAINNYHLIHLLGLGWI